jgi:hypothetical protein
MLNKQMIKRALQPFRSWLVGSTNDQLANNLQLLGRVASWHIRSKSVISSFRDVEFKVSSQWGEDGIIDWLIERAKIPLKLQTFIEFGVEDYREANTRFLLQNRNWRGLIMDGSPAMVETLKFDSLAWKHDITARPAFITRENINELISQSGFSGEIGLLSIDLDGNDYWVWESIEVVQPIICICEYNAVFGDVHPISIPYDPAFDRKRAHRSHLYFGASIVALQSLARSKGYRFVGTTSAANDAFFVREDYASQFVEESLKRIEALPSLARESRDELGQLSYVGGSARLKQISNLPVVNVETGVIAHLGDFKSIYSAEWLEMMSHGSNEDLCVRNSSITSLKGATS